MKKTYHLCLSGSDEAIFRDLQDYNMGFNYFALALYKTDSIGLAESFMSTHTHQAVQTSAPEEFMYNFRRPYSLYFNHKYQRHGRLGEKCHFTLEIEGYHHMLAAISYILRNALHHGVASTPYAYPHCSANAIFRRELGKFIDEKTIPSSQVYRHVSRRAVFPDKYKMTESGIFLRESVLDIPQVENLFVTPRSFNYYMTRKSSEEWDKEQSKDGNGLAPVNLHIIENGINMHSPKQMSIFESGKTDYRNMTDIELCTMLDNHARTKYGRHSVYQLSHMEKIQIAEELHNIYHLNETVIRRCLVLPK